MNIALSSILMSFFDVSSVFWLFFQVNLINHPHRPSLAKSVLQKDGHKTFNKSNKSLSVIIDHVVCKVVLFYAGDRHLHIYGQ